MKTPIYITATLALSLGAGPAFAQNPTVDSTSIDRAVRQAMETYQRGLESLATSQPATGEQLAAQPQLREMRLEEVVSLALEKNLDIQIAKLEPQSVDFLVAGFKNTFLP